MSRLWQVPIYRTKGDDMHYFDWLIVLLALIAATWGIHYLRRHEPDPSTWEGDYVCVRDLGEPAPVVPETAVRYRRLQVLPPLTEHPAQQRADHRGHRYQGPGAEPAA